MRISTKRYNLLRKGSKRNSEAEVYKNRTKNSLVGFNNSLVQAEERSKKHKDRSFEIKSENFKRKKNEKMWQEPRDLQDKIKRSNIYIMGVTKKTGKGTKGLFEEINGKNVPNLRREMDIEGQEIKRLQLG